MSYLKYSSLCADMVRAALKEPAKAKAKVREVIYYKSAVWKDGKPQNQVITDITEGTSGKLS
jgi:F-type H+-transporting ATPase subunit epsilon